MKHRGEKVIRGDKINVVHMVAIYHANHPFEQLIGTKDRAPAQVGNLKILAEGAFQGTPGKKDCAGSILPRNGGFLPKVGTHVGHPQLIGFSAESQGGVLTARHPVDATFPRTKPAFFKIFMKVHGFS